VHGVAGTRAVAMAEPRPWRSLSSLVLRPSRGLAVGRGMVWGQWWCSPSDGPSRRALGLAGYTAGMAGHGAAVELGAPTVQGPGKGVRRGQVVEAQL